MSSSKEFIVFIISLILALLAPGIPVNAQNQVAISYNDGAANYGVALGPGLGQGVIFTSPNDNWTLSEVAVCGKLNSSGNGLFVMEVWDMSGRILYRTADLAGSYFGDNFTWSVIDIPDLKVPRNFTICFFGNSNPYFGLNIVNKSSGRSFIAGRNPNQIAPWGLEYPHNSSEWLMDAMGYSYSPPPSVDLSVDTTGKGLDIKVQARDGESSLVGALFRIIDAQGDAVWAEQKQLSGSKGEAELLWSGQAFKISNMTRSATPVYAYNPLNISSSNVPYSAYTAQAILQINPGSPEIAVTAYFGKDGDLHAIEDGNGNLYYISQELLKVIDPDMSYANYMEKNLSLSEFRSTLTFFKYNNANGLTSLQNFVLDRSPLQHFGIKLEKIDVPAVNYQGEVAVLDSAGNVVTKHAKP